MKTQPTHTPTPWKVNICSPKHNQKGITIQTQDGIVLAHIQWQLDDSEKANAAYIVRAVNAYDPMMDLLDKVARSACLNQEVSGKCVCFSCQANKLIGVKQ